VFFFLPFSGLIQINALVTIGLGMREKDPDDLSKKLLQLEFFKILSDPASPRIYLGVCLSWPKRRQMPLRI